MQFSEDPKEFFETDVPKLHAQVKDQISEAQKAVEFTVGVNLTGDGGGAWTLHISGGELTVTPGLGDGRDLTVHMDVAHWRAAMHGSTGISAAGLNPENFDFSRLKPELAARVKQMNGNLAVQIKDGDDEVFSVMVQFGANAPETPTATISMQEADAALMREGKMLPQQAFMAGKMKVTGDMNLVMQVGALQML